jgi:hypothetical protein
MDDDTNVSKDVNIYVGPNVSEVGEVIPRCARCGLLPEQLSCYTSVLEAELYEAGEDRPPTVDEVRAYVMAEEGTYNGDNGHFLCDTCYIAVGMPSSPQGWTCP